jgi:hypothetical protein
MSEERSRSVRSRDDRDLDRLVSETRQWMKREGIEEQALDWEGVAREERALWWRGRLSGALAGLVQAPELLASAALEVTLDAVHHVGRVLAAPAQACMLPDVRLEFSYAPAAFRSQRGLAGENEESVGVFLTSEIPGARVFVDAVGRRVTVEFWDIPAAPLVALVPEDETQPVRVAETVRDQGMRRAVFEDVRDGRFLLSVYVQKTE